MIQLHQGRGRGNELDMRDTLLVREGPDHLARRSVPQVDHNIQTPTGQSAAINRQYSLVTYPVWSYQLLRLPRLSAVTATYLGGDTGPMSTSRTKPYLYLGITWSVQVYLPSVLTRQAPPGPHHTSGQTSTWPLAPPDIR